MIFIIIQILTEPGYEKSSWGKTTLEGLISALIKKKLEFSNAASISSVKKQEEFQYLIIIGSDEKWLGNVLSYCDKINVHPIILSNVTRTFSSVIYSSVTSDIEKSMYYLIHYLKKRGKTKPALYGINPASVSDLARKENFLTFAHGIATAEDIFYNNGSLEKCFENFFADYKKYDCIICANDYAAISLSRNLKKKQVPEDRFLTVSYGGTLLSKKISSLLTVSMCYEEYGKAAIAICETLSKNPALLYLNIAVKWKINNVDSLSVNGQPTTHHTVNPTSLNITDEFFYSDREMLEMILVENMLSTCDAVDFKILDLLLMGRSYEVVADNCYISHNTVKYRTKKLMDICKTQTKKDFLNLVKKYY